MGLEGTTAGLVYLLENERMNSEKIYANSPVFWQNVAISAYGWVWKRRRFGGIFEQELRSFQARESWSAEQFADYQTTQLRALLLQANANVPYYQEKFKSLKINDLALKKWELSDLPKLPFLEKNTLRNLGTTTLISQKAVGKKHFYGSSGSTGTPVQILLTPPTHQRLSAATEARVRNWAGLSRHDPRGMIGGRRIVPEGMATGPFYRYNCFEKQTYFSAYHIAAQHAADYLRGMTQHRVSYMTGYTNSNYFLARFLAENGLEAPPMKAVLTSSETLTPAMRQTFQAVYGCRTYDAWGSVESCGMVSECEYGRLHISPDVGILEFLDPKTGQPAAPGTLAEVVCTGLLNQDQPLIRYRLGDLMRVSNEACTCGRQMPVIQEIVGRMEDTVKGPDGREMVRFHGIFIGIPSLIEGQIIQHSLSAFEVKTVSAVGLTDAEKTDIIRRMQSQLGPVSVEITAHAHIPRGPNGKFKAVISHV